MCRPRGSRRRSRRIIRSPRKVDFAGRRGHLPPQPSDHLRADAVISRF
jgi:hypothetical protein